MQVRGHEGAGLHRPTEGAATLQAGPAEAVTVEQIVVKEMKSQYNQIPSTLLSGFILNLE